MNSVPDSLENSNKHPLLSVVQDVAPSGYAVQSKQVTRISRLSPSSASVVPDGSTARSPQREITPSSPSASVKVKAKYRDKEFKSKS